VVHVEIGTSARQKGVCIVLDTEFRDKALAEALPGSKYDTDIHRWTAPLTWATCKAARGLFFDRLTVGPVLAEWATTEYRERIYPALISRQHIALPDEDEDDLARIIRTWRVPEGLSLYPFQEAGVHFLATAKRALLTDEMGTGKTAQVIRTLAALTSLGQNPFPALVVCPNTLKRTWAAEFHKWWPQVPVSIVEGGPKAKRDQILNATHVVIINWETLRMFSRLAPYGDIRLKHCWLCDPTITEGDPTGKPTYCERCRKELNQRAWVTVIGDEIHRAKDPKAKQTRAFWSCITGATTYRFGLTGTPIANNPIDLWPALRAIDEKSWPSRSAYIDRYCLITPNVWSGGVSVIGIRPEMRNEFFEIVDPNMRRMPKDAVLPFLPPKNYVTRYVDMAPKQAKAYKQMEDDLVTQFDQGLLVAMNPLVQLTRLVQFASAYAEFNEQGEVRLTTPSCKVDALVDVLEDLDQEPCVVFAQSRQLIELAGAKLDQLKTSHAYVTGGQSTYERQQAVEDFQAGRTRVILCTIAAGGVGLTLTKANTAVFLQRSWSMVDNRQAEDRVHRIGSEIHDTVNIVDIVATGTVEERQREVLTSKDEMLEEIVRDRAFLARVLGRST
jgi:SNF2 family DNA or RNA helicase